MAGYNIINSCCAFTSIVHFYTFMEEGPCIRNIEAVRFFPVRVIGEADILLLLQSGNNRFLIYCIRLGELYTIDWLISENRINCCLIASRVFGEVVEKNQNRKKLNAPEKLCA